MRIAPKPTAYKEIEYRSRLEARWAMLFDLCGFKHAYEPRGEGTTPDFRVKTGSMTWDLEVKPSMVQGTEFWYLQKEGVNLLGIGGFYRGKLPILIQLRKNGLHHRDFDIVFQCQDLMKHFRTAEGYRFDLKG